MAQFRSEYEQRKWDNIAASAKTTFKRLTSGTATPEDLKKAHALISQHSKLARDVFTEGVRAIEEEARNRVQQLEEDLIRQGKERLTHDQLAALMNQAVAAGWAEQGPEIVLTVEEILKQSFEEQGEKLTKLDGILMQFMPHVATKDDLLAISEAESEDRHRSLVERLENLRSGIENSLNRHFNEAVSERKETPLERLALGGRSGNDGVSEGTPTVVLPNSVEDKLEDSIESQSNLLDSVKDLVRNSNEVDDKAEEKKANIWWRVIKGSLNAAKAGASRAGGLAKRGMLAAMLALGGKALLTELTGGNISGLIDQFMDTDKLKKIFGEFWEYTKSQGRSIADYIASAPTKVAGAIGLIDTNDNLVGKHTKARENSLKGAQYFRQQAALWRSRANQVTRSSTKEAYNRRADEYEFKAEQAERDATRFANDAAEAQRRVDAGITEVAPMSERDYGSKTPADVAAMYGKMFPSGDVVPTNDNDAPLASTTPMPGATPITEPAPTTTPADDPSKPFIGFSHRGRRGNASAVPDDLSFTPAEVTKPDPTSTDVKGERPMAHGGRGGMSLAGIGYSSSVDGLLGIVNGGVLAS